jgi:GDP-L-fucose synthase
MVLCRSYYRQYGAQFFSAIPCNLYGANDNWDLQNSHVLPALLRKVHTAKQEGKSEIEIWGDGSPWREFMLAEDLAEACIFLMQHYTDFEQPVNVGSGEEVRISTLADIIQSAVGWRGQYRFDASKPNGTPRKLMDNSVLEGLGYQHRHSLRAGIRKVYEQVFIEEQGRRLV